MKMHKITLTLLAALLAVIGTTGTVAQADGPETPPGTTDVQMVEDILSQEDTVGFNQLPAEVQDVLEDEFLPDLVAQGLDTEFIRVFLSDVVRAEKEAFLDNALGATSNSEIPVCQEPSATFSVGSRIGVYSSISCDRALDALESSASLYHVGGRHYAASRVRHNASYSSSWVYAPYRTGRYNYCGHFKATVNNGPLPQPPFGKKCYYNRYVP